MCGYNCYEYGKLLGTATELSKGEFVKIQPCVENDVLKSISEILPVRLGFLAFL